MILSYHFTVQNALNIKLWYKNEVKETRICQNTWTSSKKVLPRKYSTLPRPTHEPDSFTKSSRPEYHLLWFLEVPSPNSLNKYWNITIVIWNICRIESTTSIVILYIKRHIFIRSTGHIINLSDISYRTRNQYQNNGQSYNFSELLPIKKRGKYPSLYALYILVLLFH